MENEIFKDIPGYEGLYQASNLGRIKSLARKRPNGHTYNDIILKPGNNGCYLFVDLRNPKKRSYIHRLVAMTFIPNIENKPCVNHKNAIKLDNNLSNLEWCTRSENTQHALKMVIFNRPNYNGEKHPRAKLTEKQVIEIRNLKGIMTYKKIGELYNMTEVGISAIINRYNWKHI